MLDGDAPALPICCIPIVHLKRVIRSIRDYDVDYLYANEFLDNYHLVIKEHPDLVKSEPLQKLYRHIVSVLNYRDAMEMHVYI